MNVTYSILALAIVLEVIGTTALKASEGFSRLYPTLIMAICYTCSYYLLTIVMRSMSVGIVYAIWSGLGIVLISLAGLFFFGQKLDLPACIGLGMIVAGVIVVNVFSKTVVH